MCSPISDHILSQNQGSPIALIPNYFLVLFVFSSLFDSYLVVSVAPFCWTLGFPSFLVPWRVKLICLFESFFFLPSFKNKVIYWWKLPSSNDLQDAARCVLFAFVFKYFSLDFWLDSVIHSRVLLISIYLWEFSFSWYYLFLILFLVGQKDTWYDFDWFTFVSTYSLFCRTFFVCWECGWFRSWCSVCVC